ncbi:MAG: WD40 repeat domain-containing serine/threonine protein kinase [Vicinamibacteria bacterium]
MVDELGQGGMGTVYRARDPGLDRLVALKTISPRALGREDAVLRFQREARAAARLQHPNIVTIHELGEAEGLLYIAMELLEGRDLAAALRPPAPLALAERLRAMVEICHGLHHAHAHGVLHRDVKPANVRILTAGAVKIVDFGIARLEDAGMTRTGVIMGTPAYLSPEALLGTGLDARADMWSAGVLLYEMVAGRRPFSAPDVPTLAWRIVHEPAAPLEAARHGAPPELDAIVARALARQRDARFPDMAAMAQALLGLLPTPSGGIPRTALEPVLAATVILPATPAEVATPAPPAPEDLRARLARLGAASFREEALFGEPAQTALASRSARSGLVALAGSDGAIRVWDPATRVRTRHLRSDLHRRSGHDAAVLSLAFSPDGALLASGHADGAVHLWDLAAGREVAVRLRHDTLATSVAFSPDGATLASGGMDAVLKLWDVRGALAGEARREMHRQPSGVTALTYAGKAGRLLVTGHAKPVLRVSDARSGRLVSTLRGPESQVHLLVAARGSERLAAASRDRGVRVYDLQSRAELLTTAAPGSRPLVAIAFFPGACHFAGVAQDDAIRVWEVGAAEPVAALWAPAGDCYVGIEIYDDGRRLLAALADGRLRLFTTS